MPRWAPTAFSFKGWLRRLGIPGEDLREVLTGVVPVAIVDRHWHQHDLDVFGVFGQAAEPLGTGPATFLAVEIFAPLTQDLTIWRIHAQYSHQFPTGNAPFAATPIHVFTPFDPYDPTVNNRNAHFPWLQMAVGRPTLGSAVVLSGDNVALQVALVGGVPTSTIGPLLREAHNAINATGVAQGATFMQIDYGTKPESPPLRLKAGGRLCVQMANRTAVTLASIQTLDVSFYYSERPQEGDLG